MIKLFCNFIIFLNALFGMTPFLFASESAYQVIFIGIEDEQLMTDLRAASKLEELANRDKFSAPALKRRAEADIDNLINLLHGEAFFNAKIDLKIDSSKNPVVVAYLVDTGPVYPLVEFRIIDLGRPENGFPLSSIELQDLGITQGMPAFPRTIVAAEDELLKIAAAKGFPQLRITKREVIADQQKKDLTVVLHIDSGPLMRFGQTTITGQSSVKDEFLQNKISWSEGETFDLQNIAKTQSNLEKSGLFNSVTILYQPPEDGGAVLPMEIQVIEAKHRTIAGGIGYTTQRGIGMTGEWEHRNVFGLGQRINVQTSLWKDTQEAKLSYVLPDFGQVDQNLIWQATIEHEKLKSYSERSLSLSGIIDRKVSDRLRISYGLGYKSIVTSHSDDNRNFNLIRAPFQLRWSTANSLLDPTEGYSINFQTTPTIQLTSGPFFCPVNLTGTYYYPVTSDHRLVFAAKGTIGSIMGASLLDIPPSERFYAGGENSLRGYRYHTVSPYGMDNKPEGGRSLMTLSLEARWRLSEKIGLVGFYEVGNVYKSIEPQFTSQQLQSVGVGLRYHTPVGPLRVDFAVPLNRRKDRDHKYIDDSFEVYMSIGQSF